MENNDIKKALECCAYGLCRDCALYSDDGCGNKVTIGAIELITLHEKKIKELTEERDGFENLACTAIEIQNRMSDTIEELTEENERLRAELAERPPKLVITKLPKQDQIAKEMLEGK